MHPESHWLRTYFKLGDKIDLYALGELGRIADELDRLNRSETNIMYELYVAQDSMQEMHTAAEAVKSERDRLATERDRLREVLADIVARSDEWEEAVREIIHTDPKHGMDLTQARAALAEHKEQA